MWWFYLKYITSYHADNLNFLGFKLKKAKMTFKVKVNDQFQSGVSRDACLEQIWWF